MNHSLPPDIVVTELADGVRYVLPTRQRGEFTSIGVVQAFGGLVGVAFTSFWIYGVGYHVPWQAPFQEPDGLMVLFLLFGLFMFLMTLGMFARGLSRLLGHSEIELRGGALRGIERLGLLHWGWRRPVDGLRRFEVCDALREKGSVRVYATPAGAAEFNVINAVWEDDSDKPRPLAAGYPRAWLMPLANDLARRCRLAAEPTAPRTPLPPVPVAAERLPGSVGFVELLDQPAGSKCVVEETPDSVSFRHGKTVLTVKGDELRAQQKKIFGKTMSQTWHRHQLAEIRVGRIPVSEGPDTPLVVIRPHPGEGKGFVLRCHDEDEARWLATRLRDALRLGDTHWQEPGGDFVERPEQPADSRIVVERSGEDLALTVPPTGFAHGDAAGYLSAGFVLTLIAGVGAFFAPEGINMFSITLAILGILGVGCLVAAIGRARQHMQWWVVDDTLLVEQTTLYGTTHLRWPRWRVADVRVGYHVPAILAKSATLRNVMAHQHGDPRWAIHVHLENGDIVGLLDGYSAEELQWLATVLRRALRVPKV
jgi:hypothetical protein